MAIFKNTSIITKVRLLVVIMIFSLVEIAFFSVIIVKQSYGMIKTGDKLKDLHVNYLHLDYSAKIYLQTDDDDYYDDFLGYYGAVQSNLTDIREDFQAKNFHVPEINNLIDLLNRYHAAGQHLTEAADNENEAAIETTTKEFEQASEAFDQIFTKLIDVFNSEWDKAFMASIWPYVIINGIVIVLILVFAVAVITSINSPIRTLMETLPSLLRKEGEKVKLNQQIEVRANDELGRISSMVNNLMLQLNKDFGKVFQVLHKLNSTKADLETATTAEAHEAEIIGSSIGVISTNVEQQTSGVEQVSSTLEEMKRNLDNITRSIERQSSAVEESASTIEEMGRNIENIAKVSTQTREISNQLSQVALQGGEAVKESVASIQDVSEYSRQILKLLKLITDIAKQTNLLAMNASIEAAHAGEAGKGFAIVADEIRRLSETTNKNAKEIGDVVGTIVEKIDRSAELSKGAGEGLENIEKFARQSESTIRQLNMMIEEQNTSIKEILSAIESIVSVTEEVKIAMQEQQTGVDEFSLTMNSLKDLFLETKGSINAHLSSLEKLIGLIEQTDTIVRENSMVYSELEAVLVNFEIQEEPESEETAIKLVE